MPMRVMLLDNVDTDLPYGMVVRVTQLGEQGVWIIGPNGDDVYVSHDLCMPLDDDWTPNNYRQLTAELVPLISSYSR